MAGQRRGLGRGLSGLIPDANVSRGTSGAKATPAKKAAPTKAVAPAKKSTAPAKTTAPEKAPTKATTPVTAPAATEAPAPQAIAGLTFAELKISQIVPNPHQPRQVFDEDALAELVHSIKEIGLLQPIVVRPTASGYEIVAGERRYRATKKAGFKTIPALIRETPDNELLRDALLENLHRAQLSPLEEAAAYQQLLEDFGGTQEELATKLGRSRPQISNTLRLLKLPPAVQRRVAAGVLSAGHARALLGLDDAAAMEKLAARIVAEGLSVRTVEEIVSIGDTSSPGKAPRKKGAGGTITAPGLVELGDRLSERLDTRVKVQLGRTRGKVMIEFATLEDLRRIVEVIDPPRRGMFGEPLK